MNRQIRINVNPVANQYSAPAERIIEFSSPAGGGLISLTVVTAAQGDPYLTVELYRLDEGVQVITPKEHWH